jgi:anti-sigma factor RsiW
MESQSFKSMEGEKMNCSKARELVSPYVDEELGPPEKRAFELHIDGCPLCKHAWEEHTAVHHLFVSAQRFDAPVGFSTRIMAHLQEAEKMGSSWLWRFFTFRPFFLRAVEVAFALVVILIGMISGNMLVWERASERQVSVEEFFSLGLFQATPPGSIAGIYVSLLGSARSKGRDTDM